ncbi:MAG: 30S ribosomal protein S15 [Mycoplasma sp.]|nr:30S ribosomal protein S15 [Mycoplasma sp.]
MLNKQEKQELTKKFGNNDKNTGTYEVQVAILTHDIEKLKKHFEVNKKDNHSKRGFIAKIEKRKKLLSKLKSVDFDRYSKLIKELNLRK